MNFPKRAKNEQAPAPGFRGVSSGELGGVGNGGYSWSKTVYETNGMYLDCYVTLLHPCGTNYRGSGFQLRCLSE